MKVIDILNLPVWVIFLPTAIIVASYIVYAVFGIFKGVLKRIKRRGQKK